MKKQEKRKGIVIYITRKESAQPTPELIFSMLQVNSPIQRYSYFCQLTNEGIKSTRDAETVYLT